MPEQEPLCATRSDLDRVPRQHRASILEPRLLRSARQPGNPKSRNPKDPCFMDLKTVGKVLFFSLIYFEFDIAWHGASLSRPARFLLAGSISPTSTLANISFSPSRHLPGHLSAAAVQSGLWSKPMAAHFRLSALYNSRPQWPATIP